MGNSASRIVSQLANASHGAERTLPPAKIDKLWYKYDRNRKGWLSYSDVQLLCRDIARKMRVPNNHFEMNAPAAFSLFNTSGTNQISHDEFMLHFNEFQRLVALNRSGQQSWMGPAVAAGALGGAAAGTATYLTTVSGGSTTTSTFPQGGAFGQQGLGFAQPGALPLQQNVAYAQPLASTGFANNNYYVPTTYQTVGTTGTTAARPGFMGRIKNMFSRRRSTGTTGTSTAYTGVPRYSYSTTPIVTTGTGFGTADYTHGWGTTTTAPAQHGGRDWLHFGRRRHDEGLTQRPAYQSSYYGQQPFYGQQHQHFIGQQQFQQLPQTVVVELDTVRPAPTVVEIIEKPSVPMMPVVEVIGAPKAAAPRIEVVEKTHASVPQVVQVSTHDQLASMPRVHTAPLGAVAGIGAAAPLIGQQGLQQQSLIGQQGLQQRPLLQQQQFQQPQQQAVVVEVDTVHPAPTVVEIIEQPSAPQMPIVEVIGAPKAAAPKIEVVEKTHASVPQVVQVLTHDQLASMPTVHSAPLGAIGAGALGGGALGAGAGMLGASALSTTAAPLGTTAAPLTTTAAPIDNNLVRQPTMLDRADAKLRAMGQNAAYNTQQNLSTRRV